MKQSQDWFSQQVAKQINDGKTPEEVTVDVRLSVMKPLQAKWIVSFYDRIQCERGVEIITRGWEAAGITSFLNSEVSQRKENPFR